MNRVLKVVCLAAIVAATGCTTYYKVTDPSTDKVYYTTEVENKGGGSVQLKDAATGDKVTLQNSHVTKVNKEEYETNRAGKK